MWSGRGFAAIVAAMATITAAAALAGCASEPSPPDAAGRSPAATSRTPEPTPDSTPTPTASASPVTLGDLASRVEAEWPGYVERSDGVPAYPGRWDCKQATGLSEPPLARPPDLVLTTGMVIVCWAPPRPQGGEVPVVTALVLDDTGTLSLAESGNRYPLLHPWAFNADIPAGLSCSGLLEPGGTFDAASRWLTPTQRYFATVEYWFLTGRPAPLMDIDQNGIPCETLFPPDAVHEVWSDGWITPT